MIRGVEAEALVSASLVTAGDFVGEVIGHEASQLLRFHSLARQGIDPEGVHQLRVAARRLRSELELLQGIIDLTWRDAVSDNLAWIGAVLGERRDFDILVALLNDLATTDASLDRSIIARAQSKRDRASKKVERTLGRARYRALLVTLTEATFAPPLRNPDVDVRRSMINELRPSWDNLRRASEDATGDATNLHRLRIVVKRARYATEIASPFLDDNARAITQRLARVQDELGQLHDDFVTSAFVEAWYDSPRAARGVDPFDAKSAWLKAIAHRSEHRRDHWRAPLVEAMILIDDASTGSSYSEWANGE